MLSEKRDLKVGLAEQRFHQHLGIDVAALRLEHDAAPSSVGFVADIRRAAPASSPAAARRCFSMSLRLLNLVRESRVTTTWYWPMAELLGDIPARPHPERCRGPKCIGLLDRRRALSTSSPPVGKSGPGIMSTSLPIVAHSANLIRCRSAVQISPTLCGGTDGRHADRDARRAVGEQVRKGRRQHDQAPRPRRHRSSGNRPRPRRCPASSACATPRSGAPRCSASPQRYRRRHCRNCPGRRPAGSAARRILREADHRVVDRLTSPCGWYLPITSPTMRAHFLKP